MAARLLGADAQFRALANRGAAESAAPLVPSGVPAGSARHSAVSALRGFLATFALEPTEQVDTLSTGIVARRPPAPSTPRQRADFMAVSPTGAAGRSPTCFRSAQLVGVLRRSLDRLETCTQHEISLKAMGCRAARRTSST
jgi:hypothetical protein